MSVECTNDEADLVADLRDAANCTNRGIEVQWTLDDGLFARAANEIERLREALRCLLPGLVLDLRYANPDDDHDALRSRIKTVTDALAKAEGK